MIQLICMEASHTSTLRRDINNNQLQYKSNKHDGETLPAQRVLLVLSFKSVLISTTFIFWEVRIEM